MRMNDEFDALHSTLQHMKPWKESATATPEHEQEKQHVIDAFNRQGREISLFAAAIREHNGLICQYAALSQDLSIPVLRTGSQLVASEVGNYLQAAKEYNEGSILIAKDQVCLVSREHAAKARLDAAIGKALKDGPFAQ
jgi:hypothetical protein